MKRVVKKVYQCDYCGKLRFTREGMERHEAKCPSNPEVVQRVEDAFRKGDLRL